MKQKFKQQIKSVLGFSPLSMAVFVLMFFLCGLLLGVAYKKFYQNNISNLKVKFTNAKIIQQNIKDNIKRDETEIGASTRTLVSYLGSREENKEELYNNLDKQYIASTPIGT